MDIQTRAQIYRDYLNALNFSSTDTLCMWFSGDKNFFQSADALKSQQAISRIFARNESGQNVYLSMAAFQAGATNRVKESVSGIRHAWIDADSNGPVVLEQIKKDVAAGIIPAFAVAVESSPGKVQVIWLLDTDDFRDGAKPDIAKQESLNRALQQRYNTDAAVFDTARVLRVPGLVNHKYESKPIARLLEVGDSSLWKSLDFKIAPAGAASKKGVDAATSGDKIPYGSHDSELTRIAGKLRHDGMEVEALVAALIEICEKRCEGYGNDYREMCEKIGHSVCRYPVGKNDTVLMNGAPIGSAKPPIVPLGSETSAVEFEANLAIQKAAAREQVQAEGDAITAELGLADLSYPKFPSWVFTDTSIYRGLVKPFCSVNSRHEEFMFLPALCILLNYVANKVRLEKSNIIPSIYLACVGKRGEIIKSSCAQSAMDYFEFAGMLGHDMPDVENANGRQLVFEAGSPEGLGIEMSRTRCSNAILFYDEMTTLAAKAGIQSSSLRSKLLTMYESGKYQNLIKSKRDSYSFAPGSYCVSLILCTPTETFRPKWAELNEEHSGFDDRFFLLLQPKITKAMTPPIHVDTRIASADTRRLVDKAIKQGVFSISNRAPLQQMLAEGFTNRQEIRAEKFALAFAIDLGREEVDEDCTERGIALVEYERQVKKYMHLFESVTKEGNIQQQVLAYVEEHAGLAEKTALEADLGSLKYGTSLWGQSYNGLIKGQYIREEGTGKKGDPVLVRLLKKMVWGEQS